MQCIERIRKSLGPARTTRTRRVTDFDWTGGKPGPESPSHRSEPAPWPRLQSPPADPEPGGPRTYERWTRADELACTARCKWCRQPIVWGQIESDTADPDTVGRYVPLDPELTPHVCPKHAGEVPSCRPERGGR